jgi:hypothetical protein
MGIEDLNEPMWIGDDVEDAVGYYSHMPVARPLPSTVNAQAATTIREGLRDVLRPHQDTDGVTLRSAAWPVTARH